MNARRDLDPIASRQHLPPLTPLGRPNGQNRSRKRQIGYEMGAGLLTVVLGSLIVFTIRILVA